jgi:hypothetical protein
MWRNLRFGSDFRNRFGFGEQFFNLPPQSIWLRRIKTARHCWFPESHDGGPACILSGLQLRTMYN